VKDFNADHFVVVLVEKAACAANINNKDTDMSSAGAPPSWLLAFKD
jgi:hypothetical protein